jgi:glycerol-3-phosphate acyltransferase PlsY
MFPVYLKFKGGKGVATALGVLLGIYPYFTWAALLVFGLWLVTTLLSRYVSLGSIIAAVAFPIIFAGLCFWQRDSWGPVGLLWPLYAFAIIMAFLVVYRHRSNIQRLRAGTESKIGGSPETSG